MNDLQKKTVEGLENSGFEMEGENEFGIVVLGLYTCGDSGEIIARIEVDKLGEAIKVEI